MDTNNKYESDRSEDVDSKHVKTKKNPKSHKNLPSAKLEYKSTSKKSNSNNSPKSTKTPKRKQASKQAGKQSTATPGKRESQKENLSKSTAEETKDEDWDDDMDEENVSALPNDLPNYADKFGIEEQKIDRFKLSLSHINLQYVAIDEICLEGLDGITLEALWTRISVTTKQPLPFPVHIERYIWNIVTSREDIEFYKLPEPRGKLVLFDRYQNSDPDLGAALDPVEGPEDIYPYHPVKEKDVLGSTAIYDTRENISTEVRKLTLDEAELRYGSQLVMVATQRMRMKALINTLTDPKLELTSPQYCLLERIGRSRIHGEITHGKVSLQTISKDPKIIFYNRKNLQENKLITKQAFFIRTNPTHHTIGSLLHLTRFYNERKTKTQIMTEQIVEVLRKRPFYRMEHAEIRKVFGNVRALKKLFKLQEFQKFVRTDVQHKYRELYPNASIKEWKQKGSDKERRIRTVELINPNINVAGSWNEDEAKEESSDDEETKQIIYNYPILHQIYNYIKSGGPEGRSLKEIQSNKGMDFYSVRAAVNQLLSYNLVVGVKIDLGRQRIMKYHILGPFEPEQEVSNSVVDQTHEELEKESVEFLSELLDVAPEFLNPPSEAEIPSNADVEKTSCKGNYALIKKIREENRVGKSEVKDRNMGYKSKGGETLLTQLLTQREKLKFETKNECSEESSIVAENVNVEVVDPKQKNINSSLLDKIFKNQHDYEMAKNILTTSLTSDELMGKNSLAEVCHEICNSNSVDVNHLKNRRKKRIYKRILAKVKQIKSIECLKKEQPSIEDILKNFPCPLKFFSEDTPRDNRYNKLCNKVLKIVQPILSRLRYKIKVLPPKKIYMCKQKLTDCEILKFSENHPLLAADNSITQQHLLVFDKVQLGNSQLKRKAELEENDETKRLKLDETFVGESPPSAQTVSTFMGPKPSLAYQAVDDDNIEITVFVSTKPEEFDDSEYKYIKDNNATLRTLKRASCVVEAVRQEKIITDVRRLHKMIETQDNTEGYNVKVDKKSIERIYTRLVKSGHIKVLQINLKSAEIKRSVIVVCDPSVDLQHSLMESLIEQMKLRFFITARKKDWDVIQTKTVMKENEASAFDTSEITSSIGELKLLSSKDSPYLYNRNIGKDYGHAPKFMRMRLLHEFLFYLIYNSVQIEEVENPEEVLENLGIVVEESILKEIPQMYCKEIGWKMFIPPLPKHGGWPDGWGLVCDILLRLPLSLFVKLYNVSFVIPELPAYLEHPIKQHYLVKQLPADIRNGLLHRRKYIFSIHETLARLCYIGTLQFGPQKLKEKDQLFIYLNRNATLLDTTTSNAGYHYVEEKEYKKIQYYFATSTDVETYWYEMWNICAHSKLGLRNTVTGTYITIEQVDTKPAMVEAMKPRTPKDALKNDNGSVPGDRRGAAGLDSALWSHIKRNWIWSSRAPKQQQKSDTSPQEPASVSKQKHVEKIGIKLKKTHTKSEKPITSGEVNLLNLVTQSRRRTYKKTKFPVKKTESPGQVKQGKSYIRKVMPRADYKKKKDYDSIDKKLMENLKQSRSEWKESEDRVLTICKIVSTFLCPNYRKNCIPYTIIRDVLHKLSPCSVNKTSGACQRRLNVMFGPSEQQEFLIQIVKSIGLIPYVKKYFQRFYDDFGICKDISDKQLYGIFVFLTTHFFKHQHEVHHILEALAYKYQTETNVRKVKEIPNKNELIPCETHDCIPTKTNQQISLDYVQSVEPAEFIEYDCTELANRKTKTSKLYAETFEYPKTETEVILDTIKSVIHSTIGSRQDEVSWVYQLFRVYQNYPDELLKAALSEIRNSQMVSIKRTYTRRHSESEGLPVTSKLFQFSFYYCFTQITKYPPELFVEAHEILLGIANHRESLMITTGSGLPMECFEQGHAVGLAEVAVNRKMYFNIDIPREVLLLNPKIGDHTELIRELAVRYKNMLTLVKQGTYFKDDDENNESQFSQNNEDSVDQIDFARQEKAKTIPRTPMIQRFLKSWFLGSEQDEIDDDTDDIKPQNDGKDFMPCSSTSREKTKINLDNIEKKTVSKLDKKKKHPTQITSEESMKILESLNPNLCSTKRKAEAMVSERLRTVSENSTQKKGELLNSFGGDELSFEDYEKKLESLLSSKVVESEDTPIILPVQNENLKDLEDTQETKIGSFVFTDLSDSDTNILEKYLHSKKNSINKDSLGEDVVDSPRLAKINSVEKCSGAENERNKNLESNDFDPVTTARIQYLMNDELTVEQIMEQMLIDCLPEDRKIPKPIHLARLLVKGLFPELDEDEERLERLHQHFVIICPDTNLLCDTEENEEFNYLNMQHNQTCKNLLRKVQMDIIISDSVLPSSELTSKLRDLGATDEDLLVAEQLVEFVCRKQVTGASVRQLREHFSGSLKKLKLSTLLNTLTNANVLIRTGINYIIYVHHKHRKHWLVNSCTLGDQDRLKLKESKTEQSSDTDLPTLAKSLESFRSYAEIKLKIMPWARIDGTLNLKVFEKWMCTVLGYCLSDTMMPLMNLIRSCYYLKPVDVYYLVECLQELGCVQMVVYNNVTPCTLFSSLQYLEPVLAAVIHDFEDIFIETDISAVIKFGALLNKKMKEFEFPSDEAKKHGTF